MNLDEHPALILSAYGEDISIRCFDCNCSIEPVMDVKGIIAGKVMCPQCSHVWERGDVAREVMHTVGLITATYSDLCE